MLALTDSAKDLAAENHNLIYGFLKRYQLDVEEYYDLAAIGFCQAAAIFNPDRGVKFSVLAYRCMYQEIGHHFKRSSAHKLRNRISLVNFSEHEIRSPGEESADPAGSVAAFAATVESPESYIITKECISSVVSQLDDVDALIYYLYFLKHQKQETIAEILDCHQVQVSRILARLRQSIFSGTYSRSIKKPKLRSGAATAILQLKEDFRNEIALSFERL